MSNENKDVKTPFKPVQVKRGDNERTAYNEEHLTEYTRLGYTKIDNKEEVKNGNK